MTKIVDLPNLGRLREFVMRVEQSLEQHGANRTPVSSVEEAMADLVGYDDWLPDIYAMPLDAQYAQYLLHCDALERFSVVSFVWGPGQSTPIHDHTIWGVIGMLRGAETSQRWRKKSDGQLEPVGPARRLVPGDVERLLPEEGDIHQVANCFADRTSVSIHIYGGNIGRIRRHVYERNGSVKTFISGYENKVRRDVDEV